MVALNRVEHRVAGGAVAGIGEFGHAAEHAEDVLHFLDDVVLLRRTDLREGRGMGTGGSDDLLAAGLGLDDQQSHEGRHGKDGKEDELAAQPAGCQATEEGGARGHALRN